MTINETGQHASSQEGQQSLVIGMVLHKMFPPDPRVAREAKSLIEAGHRVFLLCLGREGQASTEVLDGLTVHRLFVNAPLMPVGPQLPFFSMGLEPFNTRVKRFRINIGSLRLSFKIPQYKIHSSLSDSEHHHKSYLLGPVKLTIPKAWFSPIAWVKANAGFFDYYRQNFFFDPVWFAAIRDFAQRYDIQVLHIHDLPLVYSGLLVKEAEQIPMVADFHENWPALVHINRNKYKGFWEKRQNRKEHWEAHERFCTERAEHIVVVADSSKARLVNTGVSADKISVVTNTIDIDAFLAKPLDESYVQQFRDRFVVSYMGGFGPHRGIDTLLEAAQILKPQIPNLLVYLAGADSPVSDTYLVQCKKLAERLGIRDITQFTGWADDMAYKTYTVLSDIGVIPHKSNEHTETTMPNKLYSYMLMEKPIICSDLKPLKAVIDETQAGVCFKSGNAQDLAEQILALYHQPERQRTMGEAGKKWVYQKYNWHTTAQELVRGYLKSVHVER